MHGNPKPSPHLTNLDENSMDSIASRTGCGGTSRANAERCGHDQLPPQFGRLHGTCRAVPGTDWHVPCTVADGRCPTKSRQAKACWYPSSERPPLAEEAFDANQPFRAMSRTSCTACMPRDSSAAYTPRRAENCTACALRPQRADRRRPRPTHIRPSATAEPAIGAGTIVAKDMPYP